MLPTYVFSVVGKDAPITEHRFLWELKGMRIDIFCNIIGSKVLSVNNYILGSSDVKSNLPG